MGSKRFSGPGTATPDRICRRSDVMSAEGALGPWWQSWLSLPDSPAWPRGLSLVHPGRLASFARAAYRTYNSEQETGFKTRPKTPSLLLKKGVFPARVRRV